MKTIVKTLCALAVAGCLNIAVAHASVQNRHLSGFTALSVSGSFDVVLTQGATESVKVDAPDEVLSKVITEVNHGVLKIYTRHDNFNWGDWYGGHKKMAVYVTAKTLNSISLSGSGDVTFREGISAGKFDLSVSGSGDITGKLFVKNLNMSITGSGDVKLEGKADSANIALSGSGDLSARNLQTLSTHIQVVGSGDATINASQRIEASVSGSGDVAYTGGATQITASKSGSGSIHRI